MREKEIFREFNGINYKEEEINEYMNFADIANGKLSKITSDIRTKLAKNKLREVGIYVEENILEKDEVVEKVIKGTDIDMLMAATAVNVVMPIPFMTGDGYSFNRLIFCTNKRIIIVNANYHNSMQGVKIYNREDIKQIDMGKEIKKKYRFKILLDLKRYKSKRFKVVLKFLFQVFCVYLISNVFSKFAYILSDKSNFIRITIFMISIIAFLYFFTTRRSLNTELLIELSDGKFYDLLIRNTDYKEIHEYLSSIN
ncbi:hypothetical protein NSA50_07745 [Clostridium sp. DSM 100503]|uniref:hypothetical protein n=1 Tax=Clostridium sp. DSM 100503 TaxID=2963282 RepID=UPI00214A4CE3|nr:hypothetical protein [Clostridium sp. DSM 100503]MCR1950954.1 hypothetical protein [Clostridium sp. DSM 100503]